MCSRIHLYAERVCARQGFCCNLVTGEMRRLSPAEMHNFQIYIPSEPNVDIVASPVFGQTRHNDVVRAERARESGK